MNEWIKIIFESRDFIVLDKSPGCLSVPSRKGADDPRPCLGRLVENEFNYRLWPVHRLDFDVSGLILFAKNEKAHRVSNSLFEKRKVKKKYEAWTEGPPFQDQSVGWTFDWKSMLLRGKRRAYRSANGSPAETRAKWTETKKIEGQEILCWELEPLTGRSHQLRFELADHGHPILGDELYGAKVSFHPGGIALRAVEIEFLTTDELKDLELPLKLKAASLDDFAFTIERPG